MASTNAPAAGNGRSRSIAETLPPPSAESVPEALRAHRRIDTHHPQLPFWREALGDASPGLGLVEPDRIVHGSDNPYVTPEKAAGFGARLDAYRLGGGDESQDEAESADAVLHEAVDHGNAERLLPRLTARIAVSTGTTAGATTQEH